VPRLFNDEEGLAVFNSLAVFRKNLGDRARLVGFDLVEDLHGLDDADGLAFLDHAADFDKRLGARAGRTVESAHHGGLDGMAGGGSRRSMPSSSVSAARRRSLRAIESMRSL